MPDEATSNGGLVDPSNAPGTAFGLAMAAIIMTIFGFIWLGWGFSASLTFTDFSGSHVLPAALWIGFYAIFVGLLIFAIQALRRARRRIKSLATPPQDFRARFGKGFRLISILEGAGCGIVVFLAVFFQRLDLIAAGISIVVGLHFLPLARLFHFAPYYLIGVAILLCDLVSLMAMRGQQITFLSAAGTGGILWTCAAYVLVRSRKLLTVDWVRRA